MSPFRCSSGHQIQLAFGDEQVRLPCPACGINVYKFRDAVMEEDSPAATPVGERPTSATGRLSLGAKQVRVAIGGCALVVGAVFYALYRPAVPRMAVSQGPVIPRPAVLKTAPANPSAGSITNFSAVPTESGAIKVSFRLTNAGGAPNAYPGLAVHWHGVPDADQQIGNDSYAHPPLPFTTTDVTLELARPRGATGIDVTITD